MHHSSLPPPEKINKQLKRLKFIMKQTLKIFSSPESRLVFESSRTSQYHKRNRKHLAALLRTHLSHVIDCSLRNVRQDLYILK